MKICVLSVLLAFCFPVFLIKADLSTLLFQCPSKTEWRFRATWYCKKHGGLSEEMYACLFNEIKNVSTETCNFITHTLDKGEQYIFRHRPVSIECKDKSRYQPFRLTRFSTNCAFLRSMCSEPGQVQFHEGTSAVDKSCRCNFEEGYAFVTKPEKSCYCIPSREDCSCYIKSCPADYVISSDYHCIQKHNKSYIADCPDMNRQQTSHSDEKKYPRPDDDHNQKGAQFQRTTLDIGTVVYLLITVIAVLFAVLIGFDKILTGNINPPSGLQVAVSTGCLKLSWNKVKNTDTDIHKYKIVYTDNDWENNKINVVEGTESFCLISNILPSKIYKFRVISCLENSIESIPSEEETYPSGTPNPPELLSTFLENGNLVLEWTSPKEGLFKADTYKISYTWNGCVKKEQVDVEATKSSKIIPNIRPCKKYTFTIASCMKSSIEGKSCKDPVASCSNYSFESEPINEHISSCPNYAFEGKSSKELLANCPKNSFEGESSTERIASYPRNSIEDESSKEHTAICANNSIEGESSKELIFHSGEPNPPPKLQALCEDEGIRLIWAAPEEDLFRTEFYHIEYTETMNWEDMKYIEVKAGTLEYIINDITINETYRFKIYAVSDSVRSSPTQEICYACPRYCVRMRIEHVEPKVSRDVFKNKDCHAYKALSELFKTELEKVCENLPGDQCMCDIEFSEGSFYAVFILVSNGYYDEDVLRTTFENTVKAGRFGCFAVSMEGFCFKSLDKPLPPKIVDVKNIDTLIQVSWSQPPKTFFKTQQYLLQITTNQWESFEEQTIPGDKYQYSVLNALPSTTYAFKVYTIVKYSIKSLPSDEMSTVTTGPVPPDTIRIIPIINGIKISWNKANHPALCHIKQYNVTVQDDENMYTRSTGTNETSLTITDLKSLTTYRFQVSTFSTGGLESDHSKMIKYKTKVMNSPDLLVQSQYLATVLNAHCASLPLVNLRQDEANYANIIRIIIDSLGTNPDTMVVGSTAEGLKTVDDRQYEHLSSKITDIIVLAYTFRVIEHRIEIRNVEASYPEYKVLRLADNKCPGYSKIHVLQKSKDLKKCLYCHGSDAFLKHTVKERMLELKKHSPKDLDIHGTAVNIDFYRTAFASFFRPADSSTTNIADFERDSDYGIEDKNSIFCLIGKTWPVEALEYKNRRRYSKWPPKRLYNDIINSGYFLAGVGSGESKDNETQWRVSFYNAEQLIIKSFNETQIHCLILLKLLKTSSLRDVAGRNITSYTMKTVMFWCLEEIIDEYWKSSNLVWCICFCLSKLKSFVKKGFLPNYFIRKQNLFISNEFTCDIQTKISLSLQCILKDPKANICLLVSSFNAYKKLSLPELNRISQRIFIKEWFRIRVSMALKFHATRMHSFWKLYDGYNIQNIFIRCKDVLEKLTTINYAQPFIRLLQNCMLVLQYILLMKEKETCGVIGDSLTRREYSKYVKLCVAGDRTHANLRIATCYLDDGVKEDCLNIIRTVTDHPDHRLFMENYSQHIRETLSSTLKAFEEMSQMEEIDKYRRIIHQDLFHQDPYRTIELFKQMKEEGHEVGGYSAYVLVWEQFWFDITFMPAELPVLPKPAALELCIDINKKKVCFNPILYGLLLEFLWHVKNGSNSKKKEKVLRNMKNCIPMIPDGQQSTGLNFITYCCVLQEDYCTASSCLIQSFKLNPVSQNVAYLYIKYIINLFFSQ